PVVARGQSRQRPQWRPHFSREQWTTRRIEIAKGRRDDADPRERLQVDLYRAADYIRIAVEALRPVGFAQHHDRRPTRWQVVAARERPAEQRPDAKHVEVVPRRDRHRGTLRRFGATGFDADRYAQAAERGQIDGLGSAVAVVDVVGIRQPGAGLTIVN